MPPAMAQSTERVGDQAAAANSGSNLVMHKPSYLAKIPRPWARQGLLAPGSRAGRQPQIRKCPLLPLVGGCDPFHGARLFDNLRIRFDDRHGKRSLNDDQVPA